MEDWKPDLSKRRVVCAACRDTDGLIVAGARHFDGIMHAQIAAMGKSDSFRGAEQGFIDQFGLFLTREEAYKVAEEKGQLLNKPTIPGTLFSEDLY